MVGIALAYFITFRTYGTWLPGEQKGHVHRLQNHYQTPYAHCTIQLLPLVQSRLITEPYFINDLDSKTILNTIINTCKIHHWDLHAVHVRSNHVHLLVTSTLMPEVILTKLKSACTKELNAHNKKKISRWARHGSTKYLFTEKAFYHTLNYVLNEQGTKKHIYISDQWRQIIWNH